MVIHWLVMTDIKDIYDRLSSLEADSARANQHVQDLEKYLTSFTEILSTKIDKLQKTVEIRFRWTLGIVIFVVVSLITLVFSCFITGIGK